MYVSEIETTKDLYSMLKSLSILLSSKSKDLSRIAQGFSLSYASSKIFYLSQNWALEIIDGWQQTDSKGLHDFKFGHKDVTIEVKSKIGGSMLVDFDSFEQLSQPRRFLCAKFGEINSLSGVQLKDK